MTSGKIRPGSMAAGRARVVRPAGIAYGVGATLASFVCFFGLGYGARLAAPLFARPRTWAILDVGIAFVMWSLALNLVLSAETFTGPALDR